MPQAVQCPHCSQRFAAADHLAGRTVSCASCRSPLEIPPLPDLSDMFDEPKAAVAVEEPVAAAPTDPNAQLCYRCKSEMTPGERYCVACGFHNFNAGETIGKGHAEHMAEEAKEAERNRRMHLLRGNLGGLLGYWADR